MRVKDKNGKFVNDTYLNRLKALINRLLKKLKR